MKNIICLLVLSFCTTWSFAQDTYFAQIQNVPMTISPALTGVMQGNIRFTGNARRQWNSIPNTQPWEQTYVAFDARTCFDTDFFAYGVQLQAERMGAPALSNLKMSANLAYHHKIGRDLYLSTGGSGGVIHYRLDDEAMTFDSQFGRQGYDQLLPTLENFDRYNRTVFDLSAGLLLFDTRRGWTAGFALHHINQPTYSFIGKDKNRLGVGLSVHGSTTWILNKVSRKSRLVFRGLYRRQSIVENSRQWYVLLGSTWKYRLKSNNQATEFGAGLSARVSGHAESFMHVDAIVPSVYLDYGNFSLGISYDLNLSSARAETHLRGGWELTATWEFKKRKGCVICPGS